MDGDYSYLLYLTKTQKVALSWRTKCLDEGRSYSIVIGSTYLASCTHHATHTPTSGENEGDLGRNREGKRGEGEKETRDFLIFLL